MAGCVKERSGGDSCDDERRDNLLNRSKIAIMNKATTTEGETSMKPTTS